MTKKQKDKLFQFIAILIIVIAAVIITNYTNSKKNTTSSTTTYSNTSSIPNDIINSLSAPDNTKATNDNAYKVINNNNPYFTKDDLTTKSWENYSDLDKLGRVQAANANIGVDLMPTDKREEIFQVRPSGWKANKEAHVYDRCHLIGFQLAGENANEKNLMTGTRFMNTVGMLPFENQIADYVKKTKNHVRYRVTPVFKGNDLVAQGVIMEAMSVEDNGKSVKFNIFCYNIQKNIVINYATGDYKIINS